MSEANSKLTPAPAQRSPALGDVLSGKYRIDGELGSGGMGVVFSATHLELDAAVAIKVMRDELARDEQVVARMLQEARAAAKMRGAHIVRVLDVARLDSGAPYIVMERLHGSDLAQVLSARGSLPVQETVDYVLQSCEGLAEAHAAGIIHRDLKPENLFLAETPEGTSLKILDFGISKQVGSATKSGPRTALTNAGSAVGSPYYMSPEQMRASPLVDTRADIWSLGAILFELLSGSCPFEGDTLAAVCANVLERDAPLLLSPSGTDLDRLAQIVAKCLEKDPSARFQSVVELAAELRSFASAEGQSSADRSARFASGIDLRRRCGPAVARLPPTHDRATPALPVPISAAIAACAEATNGPLVSPVARAGRVARAKRRLVLGLTASVSLAVCAWVAGVSVSHERAGAEPVAQAAIDRHGDSIQRAARARPTDAIDSAEVAELAPAVSRSAVPAAARPGVATTQVNRSGRNGAVRPKSVKAVPPVVTARIPPPLPTAQPSAELPTPAPRRASAWDGDPLGGRY